jgi:hypothetical protein
MAQPKVNGKVQEGQFLTGSLSYFIVDAVDGGAASNIANFGYTAGNANPGEKLVLALQTVANPVIIESANARIMYVATEVGGVSAGALEDAVVAAGFANATVTSGTFAVV